MALVTKNFRVHSLANQYAAAVYAAIKKENGGDWFTVNTGEQDIRVDIIGGISGIRELVDAYGLEALKLNYPQWESLAVSLFAKSLKGKRLTKAGREIWQSMVNDMGATVIARGK